MSASFYHEFLGAVVAVVAILGGYLREQIMNDRLDAAQIKKLIAVLLLLLATKMIWKFV